MKHAAICLELNLWMHELAEEWTPEKRRNEADKKGNGTRINPVIASDKKSIIYLFIHYEQ